MEPLILGDKTPPRLVSLVIPCFNESNSLRHLFDALTRLAADIYKKFELKTEFVFVNDGSTDNTGELLDRFIKIYNGRVIHFTRNFGQQAAIAAGYIYSKGDLIVTLDADLQDPPEVVLTMIEMYLHSEVDVVLAKRRNRQKDSAFKRQTAKLFYKFIKFFSDLPLEEEVADFRLIDARAKKILLGYKNFRFWRGLIMHPGFKYKVVYYNRMPRAAGESHYTLKKMALLALDAIWNFGSVKLVGGLVGVYFLTIFWVKRAYHAFPLNYVAIAFLDFISALLSSIVILFFGLALFKIVEASRNFPPFIIRKIVEGTFKHPTK